MNRLWGILVLLVVCAMPITASGQMMYIGEISTTNASSVEIDLDKAGVIDGNHLLLFNIYYPNDPQLLSDYILPGTLSGLDLDGNFAYLAAGDSGMLVIDISTPTDPQLVCRYLSLTTSINVVVRDTICYLMESSRIAIISIAEPANPREIANISVNLTPIEAMAVSNSMLYVVGNSGEFEFIFGYDVSNPAEPFRRSYGFDFWNVSDMIIADNRLFLTNPEWNYISTFNIANSDSIIAQSILSLPGPTAIIPVEVCFFVSRENGGITQLYCADPDTCIVFHSVDTPGTSRDIAARNLHTNYYLYVADSSSVQIFWILNGGNYDGEPLPESPGTLANYPNPFNAQTTIQFSLEQPGLVRLDIYDLLGRRVTTLLNDYRPAGKHTFVWDTANLASGIYYAILREGNRFTTRQLTLLK